MCSCLSLFHVTEMPKCRSFATLFTQVYKALNVLGNLGWRINVPVLEVAQLAWERGGEIAGLPTRNVLATAEMPALPNRFRTAATPTPGFRRSANQLTAQVRAPPHSQDVWRVRDLSLWVHAGAHVKGHRVLL